MTADIAESTTVRQTVEAATPGDEVDLTIDTYDWESPLDVVDTEPAVEWDVPYGDDWFVRTIFLKASRAQYAIQYSSIPDPERVECYRVTDGTPTEKRGDVEHLAPATTEADEDGFEDTDVDVALPDDVTPADVEDVVDEERASNGKAKLGDVADALGLTVGRARAVTHALDLYEDGIAEVYRPKAGGGR